MLFVIVDFTDTQLKLSPPIEILQKGEHTTWLKHHLSSILLCESYRGLSVKVYTVHILPK